MIKETYKVKVVTWGDGSKTNLFELPESGTYFNWTHIEGHAGYIIDSINEQLKQHNLKMIFGKSPEGSGSDCDLYGSIVPISTPEDKDLTVEIDIETLTVRIIQ